MLISFNTDTELVDRLHIGDESAFRLVFDRFHQRIFLFAFKFLKDKEQSEEIVQDTFLNLWLHREKLDGLKPLEPFIFAIARRKLIDTWRKAATAQSYRDNLYQTIESSRNEPLEKLLMKDLERITEEGLMQLNCQQQKVFKLSRYEGFTYEEIAEEMKISKSTVKYHLINALKLLRYHFQKNGVLSLFILFF